MGRAAPALWEALEGFSVGGFQGLRGLGGALPGVLCDSVSPCGPEGLLMKQDDACPASGPRVQGKKEALLSWSVVGCTLPTRTRCIKYCNGIVIKKINIAIDSK